MERKGSSFKEEHVELFLSCELKGRKVTSPWPRIKKKKKNLPGMGNCRYKWPEAVSDRGPHNMGRAAADHEGMTFAQA